MTGNAKVTIGIPTYNRAESLRETIASVLAQTYGGFRVLVSDNASEDRTFAVVKEFDDPRITYDRSASNIGMIGNFNRLIDLAETEFLMILPDDDLLYPHYLQEAVDVFEHHPTVGVVHTAFDEIDADSQVQVAGTMLFQPAGRVTVEPGQRYLERSMRSRWTMCFSSALYRTEAIRQAGGLRADEEPFADLPMWMRIATGWDFAFVAQSLVAFRIHKDTVTMRLGSEAGREPDADARVRLFAEIMFDRRMGFLAQGHLPSARESRYRSLATRELLVERAGVGEPWLATTRGLLRLTRQAPSLLLERETLRLVAARSRRPTGATRRPACQDGPESASAPDARGGEARSSPSRTRPLSAATS